MALNISSYKSALDDNYILVLTTNSVEQKAVKNELKNQIKIDLGFQNNGAYLGRLGNWFCLHLTGEAGAQRDKSIGRLVRHLNHARMPRPLLVLIVGFAWGNRNKVNIGDLIVCTEVWCLNHQRIDSRGSFRQLLIRESPLDFCESCLSRLDPAPQYHVVRGQLASCELYLAHDEGRDDLLRDYPTLSGGEMEAFDVVPEIKAPWALVKTISDFGGSDTHRSDQPVAAKRSANMMLPVLEALREEEKIPYKENNWSASRLLEIMIGASINLSPPGKSRHEVISYLNDTVGPEVLARLGRYDSDLDASGLLPDVLGILLLELAQNAVLHGDASRVVCKFDETSITLSDDGMEFNASSLVSGRGGAAAWRQLQEHFLTQEKIEYTWTARGGKRGNTYKFILKHLTHAIREARESCVLHLPEEGEREIVMGEHYPENCEALYFSASKFLMMSMQIDIAECFSRLLSEGKTLFIACRNKRQVEYFENSLGAYKGPNLRIFISANR